MSFLKNMEREFTEKLGQPPHIDATHMDMFAGYTTNEALIQIIDDILADDAKLAEIAARSYCHTLGFNKVILSHQKTDTRGQKKRGLELRLHIWNPREELSGDEGYHREEIHCHTFDFLSRIVTGKMENQCFTATPLTEGQHPHLKSLKEKLSRLGAKDRGVVQSFAADEIDRACSLSGGVKSPQITNQFNAIINRAGLSSHELDILKSGHDLFHDGTPKQVFAHSAMLTPSQTLQVQQGDIYHHPHQVPHRVCHSLGETSSTAILLTDVTPTVKGGSYRPVTIYGSDFEFTYKMYDPNQLRSILSQYREDLTSTPTAEKPKYLKVDL